MPGPAGPQPGGIGGAAGLMGMLPVLMSKPARLAGRSAGLMSRRPAWRVVSEGEFKKWAVLAIYVPNGRFYGISEHKISAVKLSRS